MSDKENISAVFVTLRRHLARAVSRIVPPRDIEDVVQETYVRVCQVEQPETIRHPRSFLYAIACNIALDHAKRAESRLSDSIDIEPESNQQFAAARSGDETYDQVAARQEFEFFCEAVRQLPVQCRRAFVLRKVYGYTQKEIAEALGLSESTIEKHIAYGIKRCGYFMAARTDQPAPRQTSSRMAIQERATQKRGGA
ncbi:MAG: RNA polymerase sigma factor [Steroidobacteraceae bacterium]